MSLVISSYDEIHKPGLARRLEGHDLLDGTKPAGAFWRDFLEQPDRRCCDVIVARNDDVIDGAAVAFRRPYGRSGGLATFLWVADDRRRQGIGTALKRSLDVRLAARDVPLQYAFIHGELEDCVPFLEATGFTKICHDLRIGWDGSDYGYKPVDGVRCELYRGGDPVMNERVAAFQNRAFVREPMVAPVTVDELEHLLTVEGHWMMVATEEATGEVVGVTECTDSNIFPSISVARRYWASGLAEWIGGLSLDRYVEAGFTKPWTVVRPENRASIAFLERMNWHQNGICTTYAAPTSGT